MATMELSEFGRHTWPLRIVLTQTDREWSGLMRHMGLESPRPHSPASIARFGDNAGNDIIVIDINGDRLAERAYSERIALYAHECVHVAQRVRKIIGSKLGSEVEAYLVQGLMLWIIAECEDWL